MTLDSSYIHQRYLNPTEMKARDMGRALSTVIASHYPADRYPGVVSGMVLDSETVTEMLGEHLLAELRAAGYSVTFTGRKVGHL